MPIPTSCFTCGKRNISEKYNEYIGLVTKYTESPENAVNAVNGEPLSPVFCALRELKIWRLCCRKMFMTIQCVDDLIL